MMPEYTVRFGQIARTLIYEDQLSILTFGFDVMPSDDQATAKWTVVLERPRGNKPNAVDGGSANQVETKVSRMALAIERVTNFLKSCGYQVKIWDSEQ